ncbi:GNAT family N-acetyltransferase [Evansella clarkii]|uniref:GNAT family N-acetyltransferase n=1 Tax=Evansella clarkii TaxID=79879 RepID=UPI001473484E|nr:GNAT family N-acetyltransferase [Evansella clarkii]
MEYKILTVSELAALTDQFCHLYRKCFTSPISKDIVRWRYLENPLNELLVCVAVDNGRVIANTAASPCEFFNNGIIEKTAISLNLMIDPDYRGKGIFTDITSKLYKYMEEKGYKSVLGFPNYLSNPTFVTKLGRQTIYEIPTLELNLTDVRLKKTNTAHILEDDQFTLNYSEYSHESRSLYLYKTREYLRWRYYKNPINNYKNFIIKNELGHVRSFIVCKEYHDKLNIVDYCFNESSDIEPLINSAIKYALDIKKSYVTVWSQIGTDEHLLMQWLGFRNNYPITYFSGKILGITENLNEFYDYRNWFINMGDDNVY